MRFFGTLLIILAVLAAGIWIFRTPDSDIAELEAKYGGAPSQFITLPLGERVHIRDQGNPAGRTLVLLHGSSASLHTWEPWVALLGDEFRIITLDLPGHGLTGSVPGCDYSVECSVRLVDDLVEYLGLDHFVIGGNSFGGNISWRYALAHGTKVDGLILSDASGGPNLNPAPLTLAFRLAGIPVANHLLELFTPRSMVKQGIEDATSLEGFATEEKIDQYWLLSRRPGNRTAMRMRFTVPEYSELYHDQLAELDIPTLIIWGREDGFVDLADGEWFGRTIPGAIMSIYDGVGHLPMAEVPELSAADTRTFLQDLPTEATEPETTEQLEPANAG